MWTFYEHSNKWYNVLFVNKLIDSPAILEEYSTLRCAVIGDQNGNSNGFNYFLSTAHSIMFYFGLRIPKLQKRKPFKDTFNHCSKNSFRNFTIVPYATLLPLLLAVKIV